VPVLRQVQDQVGAATTAADGAGGFIDQIWSAGAVGWSMEARNQASGGADQVMRARGAGPPGQRRSARVITGIRPTRDTRLGSSRMRGFPAGHATIASGGCSRPGYRKLHNFHNPRSESTFSVAAPKGTLS
jgi:hypothetical protein